VESENIGFLGNSYPFRNKCKKFTDMLSDQERFERAKLKLLGMNRKVQHAQCISKKRSSLPPLDDSAPRPPKSTANTYVFELTESMLADGFPEDEVAKYAELMERDSKGADRDLDQRELALQAELKKINHAIARIRNSRPASPHEAATSVAECSESGDAVGYAGIHARAQSQAARPPSKRVATRQPPKKGAAPPPEPADAPGVKATGAGARFLADLMGDGADPAF
jgi:hypothetical protein